MAHSASTHDWDFEANNTVDTVAVGNIGLNCDQDEFVSENQNILVRYCLKQGIAFTDDDQDNAQWDLFVHFATEDQGYNLEDDVTEDEAEAISDRFFMFVTACIQAQEEQDIKNTKDQQRKAA